MRNKGLVMSNLLYLIVFFLVYFTLVPTVKYAVDTIGNTTVLQPYYENIPSSTTQLMDMILYVVIPIAAIVFTIMASRPEPQYVG